MVKRRREQNTKNDNDGDTKKRKTSVEATCPLATIPYEEQLTQKENEMKEVLKALGKAILKVNSSCKKYFHNNENSELLPCKFLGIKPSPKVHGYRNKSEFAIGKNSNGEIIVGFRLGSYADGSIEVGPIDDLPHIPDNVKKIANNFEKFVRQSKYQVFNPEYNSGHFRQLTIRSSEINNEIMIIIGIYSQNLQNDDELNELKKEIIEFYENSNEIDNKENLSLYYQDMKRREIGQMYNPVEHLWGKTHIYDRILNLEFRISPLAFFQINTLGAEILYEQAIKLANLKPHTTVLDICCGTGTIGLCFSKHCNQVIGVDIIADAIKDAEFNAQQNHIKNVKFYAGNADDHIHSMVKEAIYDCTAKREQCDIVAIVDPPRAGLHNKSILALRNASDLNRLVYISCNPKSAQRNWIDLARPESKTYKGSPFIPKIAIAVDMFPHTTHTELVILFERMTDENVKECTTENSSKDKSDDKEEKNSQEGVVIDENIIGSILKNEEEKKNLDNVVTN